MIDTSLDSSNFYFLLAVFQGVILSVLILLKSPRRKPNIYFGLLIFLFSVSLLHLVLESSIHAFNVKFPFPMEFNLAYGPLAYLHILHIKDPLRKFNKKDLAHFVPTLLLDAFFFSSTFLYLGNHMEWAYENIPLIQGVAMSLSFVSMLQLAAYTYLIYKEASDSKVVLKDFSHVKNWLSLLVYSWSLVIGFFMIATPIALIFIEQLDNHSEWLYIPLGIINATWIFSLGFLYLLKYSRVLDKYMGKVEKFNISSDEIEEKRIQILTALESHQIYRDPKITVTKLAGHLNWPINSVSKMINETLDSNFNDLINQYRVSAFKKLVLKPESKKYSILGLGQEVGFSSKASFYRIFKKETGMTPSEYLKKQG